MKKEKAMYCITAILTFILLVLAVTMFVEEFIEYRRVEVALEEHEVNGTVKMAEIPSELAYEVPLGFKPIDCSLDEETQEFAYLIAKAYNIDFTFLMAVMSVESEFDYNMISSTNDYGLMQINECNHEWLSEELGITDMLDPQQNIKAGAYIFAGLFEKYDGNVDQVLMAYNMGEAGARKLWKQGIYETNYTKAVFEKIAEMGEANES